MTTGYLMHKCRVNVPSTVWFDFLRFVGQNHITWELEDIYGAEGENETQVS